MKQQEFDALLKNNKDWQKHWGDISTAAMQSLSIAIAAVARQMNAAQFHAQLQAQIRAAESQGQLSELAQVFLRDVLATVHAEDLHQTTDADAARH